MKKVTLWVLVALCLMVSVEPVFAANSRTERAKEATLNKKALALVKNVEELADKIAAYNKPAFEVKLTSKERESWEEGDEEKSISPVLWNRVWAKDKTIVLGGALKNKKFRSYFFKTSDPELVFAGGIRVGASINVIERYFGNSLNGTNLRVNRGNTVMFLMPDNDGRSFPEPMIVITCLNGVIKEIFFDISGGLGIDRGSIALGFLSHKAVDFANKQARQMGFAHIAPKGNLAETYY